MKKIILASASPRRKQILEQIGIRFDIIPAHIDEESFYSSESRDMIKELACRKAADVAARVKEECVVIGADTIVIGERIFGKPKDKQDAFVMLKSLSGQWHEVMTGIAIISSDNLKNPYKDYEVTRVKFRHLCDEEIYSYIETSEPMDKAGAYAIQGIGSIFVEKIEGCYFNVVGLPLYKIAAKLADYGIKVL